MSVRSEAWTFFDRIVATAPARDQNPWVTDTTTKTTAFRADFDTLARLLAVPLKLGANSQSGVPALALDVWAAYEFRRAGFDPDAVWPRARAPRVLPPEIATLLAALPKDLSGDLTRRLEASGLKGVVGANATILGKNYVKQVDVGLSSWRTGPELLVSTKRMDSSFGKNAANRVEESYGDAKNLRLRHPQAALGFMYGLRSTALVEEPDKADWLRDLLIKLGREDDAYDAVALVIPEWNDLGPAPAHDDDPLDDDALVGAGLETADIARTDQEDSSGTQPTTEQSELDLASPDDWFDGFPVVTLRHDEVPPELHPNRFFEIMIRRILDNCPINFHVDARTRLREATPQESAD